MATTLALSLSVTCLAAAHAPAQAEPPAPEQLPRGTGEGLATTRQEPLSGAFTMRRGLVEWAGLVRLGDGQTTDSPSPEKGEPRQLAGFRVVYGLSGPWGGHGAWEVTLGARSLAGQAPYCLPNSSTDPACGPRWQPEAVGLCLPAPGRSCAQWQAYPELWAAGRMPLPGGRAVLEGWLGWWPVGGLFSPLAEDVDPAEDLDLELAFNPAAPPVGGVGMRLRAGPSFTYEKWAAKLSGGETRYLLGHRVRWRMLPELELQVTELAVATPTFAAQHTVWLPFWPFYLTQHAAYVAGLSLNDDANVYMDVAARWRLGPGGPVVSGELLVDDMPQRATDPLPYQVALGASVSWERGHPPAAGAWQLDYRRVHRFVYTFQNPALSYVHGGLLLGHPDGPDTDSLRLMWSPPRTDHGAGRLRALGLEWRRRGPGRIGEIWERNLGYEEARQKQFLAGPVEHTLLLHAEWAAFDGAVLGVTAGPVWNVDGEPGRNGWLVGLRLRWMPASPGLAVPQQVRYAGGG